MSGPARTAEITVKMRVRITDTATEGEMLDAVYKAFATAMIVTCSQHGTAVIDDPETTSIITKGVGGHL